MPAVKKRRKIFHSPPLKYPGGKWYFADKIHQHAPPVPVEGQHRIILYGGGLGEFWNWPWDNVSEVVNDLDDRVMNLWRVLAHPTAWLEFATGLQCLPVGRKSWEMALTTLNAVTEPIKALDVNLAMAYYILVRQSLAGRQDDWMSLTKSRTRRRMNEQVSAYFTSVDGMEVVHERLQRAVLECDDALSVFAREDRLTSFFYADPSYLGADKFYKHTMSFEDHVAMLRAFRCGCGRIMLSGYDNNLYQECLPEWRMVKFEVVENTSHAKERGTRIETLWMNYWDNGRRIGLTPQAFPDAKALAEIKAEMAARDEIPA